MIPGTSRFYGNWVTDVRAGQFIVPTDVTATPGDQGTRGPRGPGAPEGKNF